MATTYELRKALYKTIEDTAILAANVKQAQIISFESTPFAVELYIELSNELSNYKFNLEINSDGKYSVNLIDFNGGLNTFSFAVNGNSILLKSDLDLNGLKVRKEIKYGVIANPSIVADGTPGLTWINVESAYTTQLESLVVDGDTKVDGDIEVTGIVDINNSTSIDGANIHLGGTTEIDVVTPLLDIDATDTTINGDNLVITVTTTDVVGNVNIDGAVDIDGSLNVDNINLDLNKITTLTGDFTIDSATNETIIDSNTTITGTLDTTGAAEFDSNVGIDGNVRVGVNKFNIDATTGSFIADGLAELDGGINTNDVFTVSTAGAIYTASSLEVDGSTRLDGTVDINNSLDLDAASLSLRSTQLSEVLLDANDTTNRTMTISAVNSGTGEASILVTADESITMISNDAFINATNIGLTGVTNIDGNTTIDGTTVHLGTTGASNEIDLVTSLLDIDATNTTIDGTNLDITVTTTDIIGDVNITGSLDVDNININGNTISSTNTGGSIVLDPNGTGTIDINGPIDHDGTFSSVTTNASITTATGEIDLTATLIDINGNVTINGTDIDLTGAVDISGDLDIDNININGNTISSTNTGGDLILSANGAGVINIDDVVDIDGILHADNITLDGNTISTASGKLTLDSVDGTVEVNDNLTVAGDLTVNGTTYTVNSSVVTIDDPVLTLGGDIPPVSDDNKDRGIEFRYFDTTAKVGFMGWDDNESLFTFLKDATNTSEVFDGTLGDINAGKYNDLVISGSKIETSDATFNILRNTDELTIAREIYLGGSTLGTGGSETINIGNATSDVSIIGNLTINGDNLDLTGTVSYEATEISGDYSGTSIIPLRIFDHNGTKDITADDTRLFDVDKDGNTYVKGTLSVIGGLTGSLSVGPGLSGNSYDGSSDITMSHADTSSVGNLSSNNTGYTYIQDISFTFDDFGHVTGASVVPSTWSHPNTSNQSSLSSLTGPSVVSDIDLDPSGHVTLLATRDLTLSDLGHTESYDFGNVRIDNTDTEYTWVITDGTTVAADSLKDTVKFVAGTNIQLAADATNDAIKIINTYTHPTYPGDDINIDTGALTGAWVVSDIDINVTTDTSGHVTDANGVVAKRELTLDDLGYSIPTLDDVTSTSAGNSTTNSITVGDITTTGYLRGPAEFIIDPDVHDDNTGKVIIKGDLQVDGTTTTINSKTVTIDDLLFVMGNDAADSAAANGAGFQIGASNFGNFKYVHNATTPYFQSSLGIHSSLFTGDLDGDITGDAGTLGGEEGSYYLDWGNITNKPDPNITLTGAVTGSATMTDLGSISIATTHTADPKITLAGDLTGSVTLTNLGSATLTASIAANSVALGTDTTGNYVATIAAITNGGMTINNSGTENADVTLGHSNILAAAGSESGSEGDIGFGETISIPSISYDINGHITSTTTTSVTLPANPDSWRPVIADGNTLGSSETLTLNAGDNVSISESDGTVTISSTDDTNTTYSQSWVYSGTNAILRLTAGGSGSGNDDLTLVAGDNITLTPSGDNLTIKAEDTIPNNGTLTMSTSGTGLSGSATFTANQSTGSTFTVTSNATSLNTASTIVARDSSHNFSAGTISATLNGNIDKTGDLVIHASDGDISIQDRLAVGTATTTTTDNYTLYVNGSSYINGDLYFPSDERLKNKYDIVSPESILESVLSTNIWKFAYKFKPDDIEIGIMAQDLEINFPDLAENLVSISETEEFEDQRSIKESKLVYVLWAALQEESSKRKELEEKINKIINHLDI